MHADLSPLYSTDPRAREAQQLLRACVHCGFCLATCPTYQVLGDERDSPRGRIYLIASMLQGEEASERTLAHLDRCLTCLSCETTCPSGVRYGRLLDIGREIAESTVPRSWMDSARRRLVRWIMPYPVRFRRLLSLAQLLRLALPRNLRRKVPIVAMAGAWPEPRHRRRMLVPEGCVQSVLAPSINAAAARVLDRLGISLETAPTATCCGALSHHLAAPEEARDFMRRNIDAWLPYLDQGCEAIVATASGCGLMIKEYGTVLADDPEYRDKAARISAMSLDLAEIVGREFDIASSSAQGQTLALHNPCTLQHGQKLADCVEQILRRAGFELLPVADGHLCCGSAGTYSLLQPELSQRLLKDKLEVLEARDPDGIATANIGCLAHLQTGTLRPVRHWIEWLDSARN
jgi:glycolate oxidase iron-sulfur subunit